MKTKTFPQLLIFFFFCFLFNQVQAQVVPPSLEGPLEVCVGDCAIYSTDSITASLGWTVESPFGFETYINASEELCFFQPGTAIVTLYFYGDFGEIYQIEYLITIGNGTNSTLEILSDSSCPPPDSSSTACEKVCAYSTVTYSVPGNPGSDVDWEITGADNFTIDGNNVTVDWGEPGSGLVEASIPNNYCDLEVNCGGGCNESVNGLCYAFAEVSCGMPPFNYQWSTGETTQVINTFQPGWYSVTVYDAAGNAESCELEVDFQSCGPIVMGEVTDVSSCSQTVCDGSIDITILDNVGIPYTYYWTGPNGITITEQDLYNLCVGTYTLVVINEFQCETVRTFVVGCNEPSCGSTGSLCVEILEEPVAAFSTNPPTENGVVNICEGQTVYFTNESLNAENFTWDFGPGQSFNDVNSFYTYTEAGTYTVSLIAANECYCADTTSIIIEVEDAIGPEIDCVGTICEGEIVTYTSSDDCGIFNWTISGNGTITDGGGTGDNFVTISWGAGPIGTIELAVENCMGDYCSEPTIAQVPIISENAEIEGLTRVCNGQSATYTMPLYSGTEYLWSVSGNGTIESGLNTHEISVQWESGSIPNLNQFVIVEYDNCYLGCGGKDTLDVGILPEYYLTGPVEACENEATEFSAVNAETNAVSVSANWSVIAPDGTTIQTSTSSSTTFNANWTAGPGKYQIQIEAANINDYCSDSYTLSVDVVAPPPAVSSIDGATEICPGQFYAYQAISGTPAYTFKWQINDGGTITEKLGNPINVMWTSAGPYELTVTQISNTGPVCESAPLSLTVNPIPTFSIVETADACRDETAVYQTTGFIDISYNWSVFPPEAGTVIGGQNTTAPEILWHQAGTHDLELNICGVSEIISVEVHAKPEPTVLSPIGLCVGETGLVETTTLYTGYSWVDEDGIEVSTLPNPNLGPGYYELIVQDNFGCEEDTTFFIDPYPLPDINISSPDNTTFCPGQPAPILYALETEDGYSYEWFLNGVSIGMNSSTIVGNSYGYYRVEVTDQNGCMANSNTIGVSDVCCPIGQICNDSFPPNQACFPGTLVSFEKNQPEPSCSEHSYTNTSTSYIPGTLYWTFDDPNSGGNNFSTLDNPTHVFSEAGFYTVRLRGTSNNPTNPGQTFICRDALIDTVLLVSNFDVDNACPGSPANFLDISTFLPIASIVSWEWDFGEPASGAANTSTDQHPMHIYATDGNFDVTLTTTEAGGCTSVTTKTITVNPIPTVDFADPLINCQSTALNFVVSGSANITSVAWDFGDPTSGEANTSTLENTYHAFDTPGNYNVTLFATNIYGCSNSIIKVITVEPNGLTGAISLSQPSPICEGDDVTLTAPSGGTAWLWSNGEITESITVDESEVYAVTITNAEGCEYQPAPVVIDVIPAPDGSIRLVELDDFGNPINYVYDSYEACEGEDINLEIEEVSTYSYMWTGMVSGNELQFTDERGNLLTTGVYDYSVTITDNTTGCTSVTAPFQVTIHGLPDDFTIMASESQPICTNTPTTFTVVSPQAGLTYVWNTGEVGTSITSSEPGDYSAVAVNAFGCEKESNAITIVPGPNINRVPAGCHTRCSPDTLCLPPMPGVVSYQWYFNGTAIAAPNGTMMNPIVTESGTYQLEMTDVLGCVVLSEALTLDLYDGFGNITGNVYYDVNDNGVIDGPDTLMNNIAIILNDGTVNLDTTTTNNNGFFDFNNILATTYDVFVDSLALPDSLKVINNLAALELVGCDDEDEFNFLIGPNCESTSETMILNVCQGTPAVFNGMILPLGSTTPFVLTSQLGCDSTVIVEVIENPVYNNVEAFSACAGSSIVYDGVNVLAGSQEIFNYTTQFGCDSIVTVDVIANPLDASTEVLSACSGTSIIYDGVSIPAGSQDDIPYLNQYGCDSIVTVMVLENVNYDQLETLSACSGTAIVYDGTSIPAGSQQVFNYSTQAGCDSIVTVEVLENQTYALTENLMACDGSSIIYDGTAILAGTQQVFNYSTQAGCDSIVTVEVAANAIYQETINMSACTGESIVFDGQNIFAGAQQVFNYPSQMGCDSIITVVVAENTLGQSALTLEACSGSSVPYNGGMLTSGSQQDIILTNQAGCDSTVTVTVTSNPLDASTEVLSACSGTSITYDGISIAAGDQEDINYSNQYGCDSIVTIMVLENVNYDQIETLSACAGTSVIYDGTSIPAGSQQVFNYSTQAGCDSTVTVEVLENQIYALTENLMACDGSSIIYDGTAILAGTQQVFNYSTQAGCDSIVTVEVAANAIYQETINMEACAGESIVFDGQNVVAGTQQDFNFPSQMGCDSIITIVVAENPLGQSALTLEACSGSSVAYNGAMLTSGSQQDITLTNQWGCDSTVTVTVTSNPLDASTEVLSACSGTSITYDGISIAAGDQEDINYSNQYGCDSIVTVMVLENANYNQLETLSACAGTSVVYDGTSIPAGGQQVFNYSTQAGCDSTVTVEVLENQVYATTENLSACAGTAIVYDGTSIPAGGQQVFNYNTQAGCDSIVTVEVAENAIYQETMNMEACTGESIVFDGQNVFAGTQQIFSYPSQAGCDSVVTVIVAENPLGQSALTLEACAGSAVAYNGAMLTSGSQQDITLVNQWGCDSTVTVTVTANPLDASTEVLSACAGTTVTYDGVSIAAGDQEDINYQNQYGCDSIVTVVVMENQVYNELETLSACAGTAVVYNGTSIPAGGQEVFSYMTSSGCDSIVTVEVLENEIYSATESFSACVGSSITYDGTTILAGSQEVFNYTTLAGCDSIITVAVTANPVDASSESFETCDGTSISYQGVSIAAGTQEDFMLTNQYGCDSLVTVMVVAQPLSQTALTFETCLGSTIDYNGSDLAVGALETFTYSNQFGCDSTVEVSVLSYPDFDFILESNVICENTFDGFVEVEEMAGGTPPFLYAIENQDYQDSTRFEDLPAGVYTISIQDANGCVHTDEVEVVGRERLQIQLEEVILACDADSVMVVPQINGDTEGLSFQWSDGSTESFFYAKAPGAYTLEVTNVCEAQQKDGMVFLEEEGRTSFFYIPNAFSPNNDGFNDNFKAYPALAVDLLRYECQIFDRWGNLVFVSNDINEGWSGFKGTKSINPGVFIWQVNATIEACGRTVEISENGDVTLIK